MRNLLKTCFIALILVGCEEECNLLCTTGPAGVDFEVVDKISGENLFTTGFYEENDITIKNQNGKPVDYRFISENNVNRIGVTLGWEDKTDIYTVNIDNKIEFNISFSLEKTSSECCTSTRIVELDIEGIASEIDQTTGIIKILVDTGEDI